MTDAAMSAKARQVLDGLAGHESVGLDLLCGLLAGADASAEQAAAIRHRLLAALFNNQPELRIDADTARHFVVAACQTPPTSRRASSPAVASATPPRSSSPAVASSAAPARSSSPAVASTTPSKQLLSDAKSKVQSSPAFLDNKGLTQIADRFAQLDADKRGLSTDALQSNMRFLLGCSSLTDEECSAIVHAVCTDDVVSRRDFLAAFKDFAAECDRDRRNPPNALTGGAKAVQRLHTRSDSFWNLVRSTSSSPAPVAVAPVRSHKLLAIHATPSSKSLQVPEQPRTEFVVSPSPLSSSQSSSSSSSLSVQHKTTTNSNENWPNPTLRTARHSQSSPVVRSLEFAADADDFDDGYQRGAGVVELKSGGGGAADRQHRINELEELRAVLQQENKNLQQLYGRLAKQLDDARSKLEQETGEKHQLLHQIDRMRREHDAAIKQAKSEQRQLGRFQLGNNGSDDSNNNNNHHQHQLADLDASNDSLNASNDDDDDRDLASLASPRNGRSRSASFRRPSEEAALRQRQQLEEQNELLQQQAQQIERLQRHIDSLESEKEEIQSLLDASRLHQPLDVTVRNEHEQGEFVSLLNDLSELSFADPALHADAPGGQSMLLNESIIEHDDSADSQPRAQADLVDQLSELMERIAHAKRNLDELRQVATSAGVEAAAPVDSNKATQPSDKQPSSSPLPPIYRTLLALLVTALALVFIVSNLYTMTASPLVISSPWQPKPA